MRSFQNHIPVRGRKQALSFEVSPPRLTLFQNHIPVRGRKRTCAEAKVCFFHDFKTISPQGDGNQGANFFATEDDTMLFQNHIPVRGRKLCPQRHTIIGCADISKPYPRKGTETGGRWLFGLYPSHFKTISPQGDGNTFLRSLERRLFSEKFQNHIPVRGRKLVNFPDRLCL